MKSIAKFYLSRILALEFVLTTVSIALGYTTSPLYDSFMESFIEAWLFFNAAFGILIVTATIVGVILSWGDN